MKLQPSLIPRFNNDYDLNNLVYAIKSIFFNNNSDLSTLSALFGNKSFYFTNNGRSSLYVILQSLNLPIGSKVGVPLYCCTVIFETIKKAGYIPCFIDIDPSNYTLCPQDLKTKIDELSAVIVVHTFGRPADMDEIIKISNGIPIIEDCAHSVLSEYKGKMTGTIGNASFFSLAKYLSVGGGGMIIVSDNKLEDVIRSKASLLNSPTMTNEIKHSISSYIFSFLYHKPWFGSFAFHLGSAIDNKFDVTNKKGFNATMIRKSNFSLFLKKIKTFRKKVELQRKYSQILLNELQRSSLILPFERKDTWCNYFLFPLVLIDKETRDKSSQFLRDMGIDTAKLYSETPTLARQLYGYKNDCPNGEKLADGVLIIPNYYSLENKELLGIINAINKMEFKN